MGTNQIGLNQIFPIYNEDGTSFHDLVLRKGVVDSIVMSLGDKITGDVFYKDNTLQVTMKEYVEYNGIHFSLVNPPTIVREGMVSDNGELKGMTKYSFVFYHPMCQLSNFPFTDVATKTGEEKYLSQNKSFSWIGKPQDYIDKLNKNLQGTVWYVRKSDRFPVEKDDELSEVQQFDKISVAEAIKRGYEIWGIPYIVSQLPRTDQLYAQGKRFVVEYGLPSNEIYENESARQLDTPFVFHMGQGVGLKNNSRTPRNNKIVTRIAGYGSEDNVPYGYPQIVWTGNQNWDYTINNDPNNPLSYPIYNGIVGGQYVKLIKHPFTRTHLMPTIFTETVNKKVNPRATGYDPTIEIKDYYDAIATQEYPYTNEINPQAPSYESHEFADIKPELDADRNTGIVSAVPLNADLTPADHWDDSMDDDGNYLQSYFQITLPQLSFDLYACAAITQEMQINMRSGACIGCTFPVQVDWEDYKRNFYDEDGNFVPDGEQRDLTKYSKSNLGQISVVVQKDNTTFGVLMPNIYQQPKANDLFVFIGISLPLSYITSAEARLDSAMKSYMLENNVYYFDYPLKFDEHFLATHTYILEQIRPNSIIHFDYGGVEQQLFVKQLTVKYDNAPLPQYDITLTDNIEVVLNQIGQVADDVERLGSLISILRQEYGRNVWNEISKKLSKVNDDTAQGFIRFVKGLQVGNKFVSGILGEGGVFRKDDDGKTYLEADKMYVRMKAYFDTVEIRKYMHSSGNRIASNAGAKIVRVGYYSTFDGNVVEVDKNGSYTYTVGDEEFTIILPIEKYRCYFRGSDGENTVTNDFEIGDQIYCNVTNVSQGTLSQHQYWRLCVGKGVEDDEHWIDISNKLTETLEVDEDERQFNGYMNGSDSPLAQDDIVQLGHVYDTTRQGAIIEYVSGADAPTYQIYQGINSYSLNEKNHIALGYSSQTGRAYMNVYGDMYVGEKGDAPSTYIRYTQPHKEWVTPEPTEEVPEPEPELVTMPAKLEIKAIIDAQSTMGGRTFQNIFKNIQDQLDGVIDNYFLEGVPSLSMPPVVSTEEHPYSDPWLTGNETPEERAVIFNNHLGDLYYDKLTDWVYRFESSYDPETEITTYSWQHISDDAIAEALRIANQAKATADGKRRVFTTTPYSPYDAGDLWVNVAGTFTKRDGTSVTYNNDILKCIAPIPRSGAQEGDPDITTFNIGDWSLASGYTDDTKFNNYLTQVLNGVQNPQGDSAVVAQAMHALKGALNENTTIEGGLILTSLISLKNQGTVWSGISGQYQSEALGKGIAAWYGGAMADMGTMTDAQKTAWDALTDEQKIASNTWAKSLFRFDGSGYLAANNIYWNAAGSMVIRNLQTIYGTTGDSISINTLSSLSSIFATETYGSGATTELLVNPQNAFSHLFINRTGNVVTYPQDLKTINDYSVLNFGEMKARFVTVDFFNALFQAKDASGNTINVNTANPSVSSIKALVGLWTEQYLSALGQNSLGGGGGVSSLSMLDDVNLDTSTLAAGQVLKTRVGANGIEWYNGTDEGINTTYKLTLNGTTNGDSVNGVNLGSLYAPTVAGTGFLKASYSNNQIAWTWDNSTYLTSHQSVTDHDVTLSWNTRSKIATIGATEIHVTMPANPDTNTWRNIYLSGTQKLGTGIDTKALNFLGDGKTIITFLPAGTEEGQSGSEDYATLKISSTWRGIQDNLTSDSSVDSLSAKQGKVLKSSIDTLSGYFENGVAKSAEKLTTVSQTLFGNTYWTSNGVPTSIGTATTSAPLNYVSDITMSGKLKIGDIYIEYDQANNAIEIYKLNGSTKVAANLYAYGGVSALGYSSSGSGGGVTTLEGLSDVDISSPSNGQVLTYSNGMWVNAQAPSSSGVTSVGMTVPTGFAVSPATITSSGTFAITFTSGYSLPTTVQQTNWDTAYTNNHTHSNKSILDGISQTDITNWNAAYSDKHSHSNKSVLDDITSSDLTNWGTAYDNTHTHSNKSVLDGITSTKVSNWDDAYSWGNHANAGYMTIEAFERLFNAIAYDGTKVNHPYSSGVASIKAMLGLWTEQYLSSLGLNSSGGGSGISLNEPLDSINISNLGLPSAQGQVITWNGSQWTYSIPTSSGGTVTSITAGTGLSGGTITSSGTISLSSATQTSIAHGESAYNSLSDYLPLTAGSTKALSGDLYLNIGVGIEASDGSGLLVYKPSAGTWTGVENTQWAVGALDAQGVIRSGNNDLIHYKNGANYKIYDAGNINTAYSHGTGISITDNTLSVDGGYIIAINSTYQTYISHGEAAYSWGDHRSAGYMTITAFENLFRAIASDGTTKVNHPYSSGVASIKAMVGLWTEQYLSALGQNSSGGGSVVDMDIVWQALAGNTTEQINVSHLTTALSGYAQTSQLSGYLARSGGSMTNTNLVTNLNADLLDGVHIGGLFTDFSNITTSGDDNNKTSITIGGTTKKLIINYAANSGSAASAARLGTVSKTAWGRTFWTENGVPETISGTLSNVADVFSDLGQLNGFNKLELSAASNAGNGGAIYFHYNGMYGRSSGYIINDADGSISVLAPTGTTGLKVGTRNGDYIQIGDIRLVYESSSNSLKVISSDNSTAANFYATGAVSALGLNASGGSGGATALGGLTDVQLTNETTGQLLKFNGTKWVNFTTDYATTSQLNNYLPLSGGTLTGTLTCSGAVNADGNLYTESQIVVRSGYDTKIIIDNDDHETYWSQISFRDNGTEYGWLGTAGSTDLKWGGNTIIHSGNIGSQSVYYATHAGSATDSTKLPLAGGGTIYDSSSDYTLSIDEDSISFGYNGTTYGTISLSFGVDGAEFDISSNATIGGNTIINSGNIGSQSVNFANSSNILSHGVQTNGTHVLSDGDVLVYDSGSWINYAITSLSVSNADTVDNEHASAFAHRGTANNLLVAGNEFNFISDGFDGDIYINYQDGNRQSAANVSGYYFCNGRGVYNATLYCGGVYKYGYGSSAYVLTTDGGAAQISQLSVAYAATAGSATDSTKLPLEGTNYDNTTDTLVLGWGATIYREGVKFGTDANDGSYIQMYARGGQILGTKIEFGKVTSAQFVVPNSSGFLKADGSVDSNTYALSSSLSSYLPLIGGTISNNSYNTLVISDSGLQFKYGGTVYGRISFTFTNNEPLFNATNLKIDGYDARTTNDCYISGNTIYVGSNSLTVSSGGSGTVTSVATGTGLTGGTITTSGTISINSTYQTYISNGNTAYGWGNHASQGYIQYNEPTDYDIAGRFTFSGNYDTRMIFDDYYDYYQWISFRRNGVQYGWLGTMDSTNIQWNGYNIYHTGNLSPLTTSNYSSYALPLTGGTLSGSLGIGTAAGTGYALDVDGTVRATGFSNNSDIRKKDVYSYGIEPTCEAVANAPAIRFMWKEKMDKGYFVGSIAQYWESIVPEAVNKDVQGYLSMQYDVIALLASIATAKRIIEHERRIETLERENALLRMEINELKAA